MGVREMLAWGPLAGIAREPPLPPPKYPRCTIWLRGQAVDSGDIDVIYAYDDKVKRILYRNWRFDGEHWTYSVTFFWDGGAWGSAILTETELLNFTCGTAARLAGWPEPETI